MNLKSLVIQSLPCWYISLGIASIQLTEVFFPLDAYSQDNIVQNRICDIGSAPTHPGNYKVRGSIFLARERFQEALDCFELALQDDRGQGDPELWNNHALALVGLKKFEEAIASYDRGLQIEPGARYVDRVQPLAQPVDYYMWWFNRVTALLHLNRYEEAIASFDKSHKLKSDYSFVWLFRGLALFKLERYEEARISYRRSVALAPDTPYQLKPSQLNNVKDYIIYYSEAEAKARLGRYNDSVQSFDQGRRIRRNNQEMRFFQSKVDENIYETYFEGIRLLDQGENARALVHFEQMIEFYPNYADSWDGKADALMNLQRYPEALAAYERATILEPDEYSTWYKKGNALMKVNRNAEALEAYQQSINLSAGFAEVWHNRGVILDSQNKPNEAIAAYTRSLKADKLWKGIERVDTQYALAASLYRAGRYRESFISVEKVLKQQPDYKEALELRKLLQQFL
jgi:tetratricopeptide (TPR) repeat protein